MEQFCQNSQTSESGFISTTISFVDSVERIIAPKRESNLRENRNERNAAEKKLIQFSS